MIYGIITYDQYGRESISRVYNLKSSIELHSGEIIKYAKDIDSLNEEVLNRNQFKVSRLREMSNDVVLNSFIPKYESNTIDKSKISEEGFIIIGEYLKNQSDLLLGKLMAKHNEEQWSANSFCCGSQKKEMYNLLIQLHV